MNKILAEGLSPEDVINKAEKTGIPFIMLFLHDPNTSYVL